MQTVFEDVLRRDRRLWISDLGLQVLANYSIFRDLDLAERCVFQFAAVKRKDGSLPARIIEKPRLVASTDFRVDRGALLAMTVCDYMMMRPETLLESQTYWVCTVKGWRSIRPIMGL